MDRPGGLRASARVQARSSCEAFGGFGFNWLTPTACPQPQWPERRLAWLAWVARTTTPALPARDSKRRVLLQTMSVPALTVATKRVNPVGVCLA